MAHKTSINPTGKQKQWPDPFRTITDDDPWIGAPTNKLPTKPVAGCPQCGATARLLAAEKAATVSRCSRRQIYRWIEDGSLHFLETAEGEVLVCGKSLAAKLG